MAGDSAGLINHEVTDDQHGQKLNVESAEFFFEGRGRCHPCFAQSPKKPFLKSEKVPQVQIWITTSCLDFLIFHPKQFFSVWKRQEVVRSMWTLTRRKTCDSEQPVIDSLNSCDPLKFPPEDICGQILSERTWALVLHQTQPLRKGKLDFGASRKYYLWPFW